MQAGKKIIATVALLFCFTGTTLFAQQTRKALSNPEPIYPELAKRMRLTGTVKATLVIGADGLIKDVQIHGGHPVLIDAVESAVKKWKYTPGSSETTAQLEFNFHQ
jgi:TonB family protein